MPISKDTKSFIDSLVDYYISEAGAYKQFAEIYVPEIDSPEDTAFGIIAGCVYSSFLQTYTSQKKTATLEEIQEFNKILKDRAPLIKKAIINVNEKKSIESKND